MNPVTKSIFLQTIVSLLLANSSFAQETIEVKCEKAVMSQGMQNAYSVNIPMGILKDVQTGWIKKLQENNKAKAVKINDEFVMPDILVSAVTADTISVYTLFIEKETSVTMHVFVQIDSVFFSPSEDKTHLASEKIDNGIKKYIRDFAVAQYRLSAQEDLEAEQKLQKDLEDEYEKLGKQIEGFKKDISSLENEIEKTEREIVTLDKEIELKNQQVLDHKTSMLSLSTDIEKDAAKDKEKELDKEKNKLEKERMGKKNDISDMKSDIEKNNKNISENEKLMQEKMEEINMQKEEVAKAQALMEGIK